MTKAKLIKKYEGILMSYKENIKEHVSAFMEASQNGDNEAVKHYDKKILELNRERILIEKFLKDLKS